MTEFSINVNINIGLESDLAHLVRAAFGIGSSLPIPLPAHSKIVGKETPLDPDGGPLTDVDQTAAMQDAAPPPDPEPEPKADPPKPKPAGKVKPGDDVEVELDFDDLDETGMPWDPRIHSVKKGKLKSDGSWKLFKGIDKDFVTKKQTDTKQVLASIGTADSGKAPGPDPEVAPGPEKTEITDAFALSALLQSLGLMSVEDQNAFVTKYSTLSCMATVAAEEAKTPGTIQTLADIAQAKLGRK